MKGWKIYHRDHHTGKFGLTLGIHSFYAGSQALRRCIIADEPTQVMTTPNPCQTQVIFPCQMFEIVRGGVLVSRAAGLGDDTLELVDLLLGTAEGTEL